MMRKIFFLAFSCLYFLIIGKGQSPFTAGNIVVLRLGDGVTTYGLNTAPAFLDEYTPSGTFVQSIPLPVTDNGANSKITFSYSRTIGGLISLSSNGQFLTCIGYKVDPNTAASPSPDFDRTIARIDYNGIINSTTTIPGVEIPSGSLPMGAITADGTGIWTTHSSRGVRYSPLGSNTATIITTVTNASYPYIYNNQLYTGNRNETVSIISGGLPTTGPQTSTFLPGFTTALTGNTQIFFADLDPTIPGADVLYTASEGLTILSKYSLVSGTWVSNGHIGVDDNDGIDDDNYRGITGVVNGNIVTLYCTRKTPNDGSDTGGGELVTLVDNAGYNGAFSGTPTVIKTAAANTTFRGVALVPQPPSVSVSVKAFLLGAYNSTAGRHKDVSPTWATILNTSALNQPYSGAPFNYTGTESVTNGFFKSTGGTDDIVDWVLLELHDANTPSTIIARKACFIREDGQVVDLDGISNPSFTGVGANNYYIVLRHRNHLAIRSSTTVFVGGASPVTYDFTTAQSKAFQNGAFATPAMKDVNSTFCIWGGNVNQNNNMKYTGPQNDAIAVLGTLGGDQVKILNSAYNSADVNLDGQVKYTGPNNDAIAILGFLGGNQVLIVNEHQ